MAIRIVTDSCSDLPLEMARNNGITVLPLYVHIGNYTYRDGVDIDADRFYSLLEPLPSLPTTSQPSVHDFLGVYQQLLDEGHQIVSIHVSGKLSGTLNSAIQARELLGASAPVAVVDSRLAGGAQALMVMDACQWVRAASDVSEVCQRAVSSRERYLGFVLMDTMKYLQRGGRIGRTRALLGGALQIKPIISIRDGEAHLVERPRTRRRAVARVIDIVRKQAPLSRIHVSYTTGREQVLDVIGGLADLVEPENRIESRFGPVLGAHLGPNTIGVAVSRLMPDA